MLSAAIVVFREVFEIVLIVGIVLAATKNMPGRLKPLALGFGGGLLGSALIALFTGEISKYAEGMGQEYFNAGILFVAAGFIGWTVIWMKKNARHMKKQFEDLGNAVTQGRTPALALAAIIALTILREGSEIVLFTYGMIASGQPLATIISGSLLGMTAGIFIGGLLYFGLIKLSVRVFFRVTGGLLVLLVAGMVSKAFGFLCAAGDFPHMAGTVWDTSQFVSEGGILGKSLGTLIGYTARPALVQVIAYAATLGILMTSMRMIDKNVSIGDLFRRSFAAGTTFLF